MCTNGIRPFFDSNLRVGLLAGGNPLILRAQGDHAVGYTSVGLRRASEVFASFNRGVLA
jgi:hypothetical protein